MPDKQVIAGVFAAKQVVAAIARLPRMSSAEVEQLRARSIVQGLAPLQAACEAELSLRPFDFTKQAAMDFGDTESAVQGMLLVDAIRYAFAKVIPANNEEIAFLRWVAEHPGGYYHEAEKIHGKRDLGLVIGHLVYCRFGCFRQFMQAGDDQSSLLLKKDRSDGKVRYWLRSEAETVFREIGLI